LTVIFAASALLGGCGGGASHSPSPPPSSTAPSTSAASPPGSESSKSLLAPERFREGGKGQQTAPSVIPATGGGTTPFVLTLTARTRLGVTGDSSRLYRIVLQGPEHRCNAFTQILAGRRGARLRTVLQPPIQFGWCPGTHDGTVVLDTTTHCLPPTPGRPPCRLHPPRDVAVGHFRFTVR
jgi:hypothetical protein